MSVSNREFAHVPNGEAVSKYYQALNASPDSVELYPDPQLGLLTTDYLRRDRQAMLTIGSLGRDRAFETLDDWLRADNRQSAELKTHYAHESHAPVTAVLAAGRYACRRREKILEEAIKPEAAEKWNFLFNNQTLVKNCQEELRLARYGNNYSKARVVLAKLSILSEMYLDRTIHPM